VKRPLLLLAACSAAAVTAAATAAIAPFSGASPGAGYPAGWREITLPRVKAADIALVNDGGATVLRIRADAAASSLAYRVNARTEPSRLAWRWKIDHVVRGGDLARKQGDDYAARVFVTFDLPLEALPLLTRLRFRLARLLFGAELPTAALCYVWDNRHAPGTTAWNAYSDQVRMVVLQSGEQRAGQWIEESRDVAADFAAAFGSRTRRAPVVTGVALSADTDQTGETVTAWFGDVTLSVR
jgi:hypothetical protein